MRLLAEGISVEIYNCQDMIAFRDKLKTRHFTNGNIFE